MLVEGERRRARRSSVARRVGEQRGSRRGARPPCSRRSSGPAGRAGSASSTSAPTVAATSSHARSDGRLRVGPQRGVGRRGGEQAGRRAAAIADLDRLAVARARLGELGAAVAQRRDEDVAQAGPSRRPARAAPPSAPSSAPARSLASRAASNAARAASPWTAKTTRSSREPPSRCRRTSSTSIARRLGEREAADAGAERDERERAGAELVRLVRASTRWRARMIVGRGRAAELHRGCVDDPAGRHVAAPRSSTASPSPIGAFASRTPAGSPARRRARSRRPRRRRAAARVLAALAIASTVERA